MISEATTYQRHNHPTVHYPHSSLLKFIFKAPILLWRMGMGPILGHFLVLVTHTGRKSGLTRRTVTEYHRTDSGRVYVPCAFGQQAQWYRNILANPVVTIQTARGTEHMRARRVTENAELLRAYRLVKQRNPIMLDWYLKTLGIENTPGDVIAKKDRIVFITFDPTEEPGPPPLRADLRWMWPVMALGMAAIGLAILVKAK